MISNMEGSLQMCVYLLELLPIQNNVNEICEMIVLDCNRALCPLRTFFKNLMGTRAGFRLPDRKAVPAQCQESIILLIELLVKLSVMY